LSDRENNDDKKLFWHEENKKTVAAVNRTRGSCMASTNFTTKPLRL
jgi:post-segregation antitoxin (ccd killing protein)